MSRILKNVHASARRPHDAGLLDSLTMRAFDALCLPPLRLSRDAAGDGIMRASRMVPRHRKGSR